MLRTAAEVSHFLMAFLYWDGMAEGEDVCWNSDGVNFEDPTGTPGPMGPGTVSALILPPQRQDSHWAALGSTEQLEQLEQLELGVRLRWNISGWPWNFLWLDLFQA